MRFLSHDNEGWSDWLSCCQNSRVQLYNRGSSKLIIMSASRYTRSNKGLVFEENNHKEADTLLIYQAVLASQQNPPDAQLAFFSPHTDVLVLVTPNYHLLLGTTNKWMDCWNQWPQRSSQHQRPSLRWSKAGVNQAALLADVPAKWRTYPVLICVSAAASGRTPSDTS